MNVLTTMRPGFDIWEVWQDDDARFKRITRNSVLAFVLVGIVMPWLPVVQPERLEPVKVPERIARMVLEQKPPTPPRQAAPAEVAPAKAEKKPQPVDKPKPVKPVKTKSEPKQQTVREKVSKVGLLALSNELADIQQLLPSSIVSDTRSLQRAEKSRSLAATRPDASRVTQVSKGVAAEQVAATTTQTSLAGQALSKLELPVGVAENTGHKGQSNARARTLEDISRVLERSKSSFYILYNRELRKNPGIKGRVLFEIKIAPDGSVISCRILQTELATPALERRLILKIKSLDFGARDVDTTLINYPLEFSPA